LMGIGKAVRRMFPSPDGVHVLVQCVRIWPRCARSRSGPSRIEHAGVGTDTARPPPEYGRGTICGPGGSVREYAMRIIGIEAGVRIAGVRSHESSPPFPLRPG